MIFDDIADIMQTRPIGELQRRTGLRKDRIYSLRCGCTFRMDYELLGALNRMGYQLKLEQNSGKPESR